MEHGNPVGQLHHHLHVVLDDQDGQIAGDAPHQLHRLVGFRRTHPGGRLVETKQPRLGCQRDADFQIALFAMRQVGCEFVRLAEQADRLQRHLGPFDDVAKGPVVGQQAPAVATRLGGDAGVFERRGVGQDIGDLIGAGDPLGRPGSGGAR